jgi:hypothetical protein
VLREIIASIFRYALLKEISYFPSHYHCLRFYLCFWFIQVLTDYFETWKDLSSINIISCPSSVVSVYIFLRTNGTVDWPQLWNTKRSYVFKIKGTRWRSEDSMLQARRSRVRDPMRRRFSFSIYLILPAALGPGVYSASNRNEYQKQKNMFLGSRARPVRGLTTLPPSMSQLPGQFWILNISQPYRPPQPVMRLTFYVFFKMEWTLVQEQGM